MQCLFSTTNVVLLDYNMVKNLVRIINGALPGVSIQCKVNADGLIR